MPAQSIDTSDQLPHFGKIMVIGAHPDDAEFHAGGLMISQARRGAKIAIVSLTDGSAGHHELDRPQLAARRRDEAGAAARRLGAELHIWPDLDGELTPSLERRFRLLRAMRRFAPDLVVTHRPWDYHPDHRATAVLVQDACYLLRVPNIEPDVPALKDDPVVLSAADFFTRPVRFSADLILPIDDLLDDVVALLECHASQVYEWLPHVNGETVSGERRSWLKSWYGRRPNAIARRYQAGCDYAEAFELSEYGRRVPLETLASQLGALSPGVS